MPQAPDWKRYLEAGMQFTELRRSQASALAADLVSTGQLAREQVAAAIDEMIAMSKRRTEELRAIVGSEVQRQLGSVGLATQADLVQLERRLNGSIKKSAKQAVKKANRAPATKRSKGGGNKSSAKQAG